MPMNAVYKGPEDLPGVLAVFPLPGALLLPRGQMPLNIFEPRYLTMVDDALRNARLRIWISLSKSLSHRSRSFANLRESLSSRVARSLCADAAS